MGNRKRAKVRRLLKHKPESITVVALGELAEVLGLAGGCDEYLQHDEMVAFLVAAEGVTESQARRSIREDVFKGLLTRTDKGYRVNRDYRITV